MEHHLDSSHSLNKTIQLKKFLDINKMALQEELEKQGNWLFKYRSYLPLIILFIGTVLYLRKEIYPDLFILEGTKYKIFYEMFALAVGLFGLYIRIITVGRTPKNTSGRNTKEGQVADTLNTKGMYSIVRHPLYLGNFFMWTAPAMLTGNFWFIIAFIFFYWVYYERIMFAEEQFLRRKFGEKYITWSENVPAFIPKFKNYQKSDFPFCWKKVLKKEKNGLFALFLIFCILNVTGELIKKETNFNYFLIAMCILIGIVFAILKYLQKHTSVLEEIN